jgi:hypothetical protein
MALLVRQPEETHAELHIAFELSRERFNCDDNIGVQQEPYSVSLTTALLCHDIHSGRHNPRHEAFDDASATRIAGSMSSEAARGAGSRLPEDAGVRPNGAAERHRG